MAVLIAAEGSWVPRYCFVDLDHCSYLCKLLRSYFSFLKGKLQKYDPSPTAIDFKHPKFTQYLEVKQSPKIAWKVWADPLQWGWQVWKCLNRGQSLLQKQKGQKYWQKKGIEKESYFDLLLHMNFSMKAWEPKLSFSLCQNSSAFSNNHLFSFLNTC